MDHHIGLHLRALTLATESTRMRHRVESGEEVPREERLDLERRMLAYWSDAAEAWPERDFSADIDRTRRWITLLELGEV